MDFLLTKLNHADEMIATYLSCMWLCCFHLVVRSEYGKVAHNLPLTSSTLCAHMDSPNAAGIIGQGRPITKSMVPLSNSRSKLDQRSVYREPENLTSTINGPSLGSVTPFQSYQLQQSNYHTVPPPTFSHEASHLSAQDTFNTPVVLPGHSSHISLQRALSPSFSSPATAQVCENV